MFQSIETHIHIFIHNLSIKQIVTVKILITHSPYRNIIRCEKNIRKIIK
jgi:hypothetical protein